MIERWKTELSSLRRRNLFTVSLLSLFLVFYVNNLASNYADKVAGAPINDLMFDLLPKVNVDFVFHWVALLFWVLVLLYFVLYPKNIIFVLFSLSGFVLLRSGFIVLTHLGPPEVLTEIPSQLGWYSFQSDLFFSGHVGAPLLLGFLAENKVYKISAFAFGIFMLFVVLLGRFHYSIDVFASIFIAHSYSILCLRLKTKFDQ